MQLSALEAVATGADVVVAAAGVADVNLVELAVHAVGIVLAFGYAARNAAIHRVLIHTVSSLQALWTNTEKNIKR